MSEVIEFASKRLEAVISRGRVPLTRTHLEEDDDTLAARILRIKASLEKINLLMAQLKKENGID